MTDCLPQQGAIINFSPGLGGASRFLSLSSGSDVHSSCIPFTFTFCLASRRFQTFSLRPLGFTCKVCSNCLCFGTRYHLGLSACVSTQIPEPAYVSRSASPSRIFVAPCRSQVPALLPALRISPRPPIGPVVVRKPRATLAVLAVTASPAGRFTAAALTMDKSHLATPAASGDFASCGWPIWRIDDFTPCFQTECVLSHPVPCHLFRVSDR